MKRFHRTTKFLDDDHQHDADDELFYATRRKSALKIIFL